MSDRQAQGAVIGGMLVGVSVTLGWFWIVNRQLMRNADHLSAGQR